MKSKFFVTIFAIVFFTSCANSVDETKNSAAAVIISSSSLITDDGSSTNYTDETEAEADGYVSEDLYENFTADGTVFVNFLGTSVNAYIDSDSDSVVTAKTEETSIGKISGTKVTILLSENTEEDEDNDIDAASNGVILQYKGTGKVKYVLSGDYTGTVFIKNKKADAAVVLNNANITSESGAGPALRFSSELRTFIVIPEGTTNSITDTRLLNQSATIYDTKKGSLYAKGALIFTGEGSAVSGGNLSVENKGYKHAIYSKDYVRIENVTLDVSVSGTTGRDCIRALNAVIIDNGRISLTGNGTITDDESVGIKVEGEDADEDDLTLEYTSGAGFVIINGGTIESRLWQRESQPTGSQVKVLSETKATLRRQILHFFTRHS